MESVQRLFIQLVLLPNGESQMPLSLRAGAEVQLFTGYNTQIALVETDETGSVTIDLPYPYTITAVEVVFVDGRKAVFMPNLMAGKLIVRDPSPKRP